MEPDQQLNQTAANQAATPADNVTPAPADPLTKEILDAAKPKSLAERREEAAIAMQGPELAAKREAEARHRALKAERATIKDRLVELAKKKEKQELEWIKLDERRQHIKQILTPIIEQETKIETEETKLEEEQRQIGLPKERRAVEEKLWQIEDTRRQVEKEKWLIEEKLLSTESEIDADTKIYRALLDEEDALLTRLDQIEKELADIGP